MLLGKVLFGVVLSLPPTQNTPEVLPAPTGPHRTGRMSFHWKDRAREELETSARGDTRELMVHVFYPADPGFTGTRAVYMPDADVMRPPFTDAQLARIQSMRAHSRENATPPRGNVRYPVVIFAPGGGMKGLTYHAITEDLASHGYVVVAIDPPYNARGVRFPDGRVLGSLAPAERGWPQPRNGDEERRFYIERVGHWSRDVRFVIDQLVALDHGNGPLARRLDLSRGVGVAGHSRGGQAAGSARLIDARVRGSINLDGTAGDWPGFLPVTDDTVSGAAPFLWIQKSLPSPPTDEQLKRAGRTRAQYDSVIRQLLSTWHARLGRVSGGALRVYIDRPGLEHIDFSDEPFWDGNMTAESRPGKLRTTAETRAWVRAFFDGSLRGEWSSLKRLVDNARRAGSDITVHSFGQMWP